LIIEIAESMQRLLQQAADSLHKARKVLAISHIDADGISAMAIVIKTVERQGKDFLWRNIHQLNSETIYTVVDLVKESGADLVIFSDLGTGQMHLIQEHVVGKYGVDKVIVLDHHLPSEDRNDSSSVSDDVHLIEVNPCQHGYSGS
jgi:single-stranded-DNA-specific exonuclease